MNENLSKWLEANKERTDVLHDAFQRFGSAAQAFSELAEKNQLGPVVAEAAQKLNETSVRTMTLLKDTEYQLASMTQIPSQGVGNMITAIPGTKATITDPETGQTAILEVQAWDKDGYALVYNALTGHLMRPRDIELSGNFNGYTAGYYVSPRP